ncbi:MAG: hypothetical protein IT567_00560 [Alphaproteobacteria bacterium]|nr:hypothetical protein [Alphaproteobacteria bacterium]
MSDDAEDDGVVSAANRIIADAGKISSAARERGAWAQGSEVAVNASGQDGPDELDSLVARVGGYTRKVAGYTLIGGFVARLLKKGGSLQQGRD